MLTLLLTGVVPLTGSIEETLKGAAAAADREKDKDKDKDKDGSPLGRDPYAYPTLLVTTVYHALTAFYLYTQVAGPGSRWSFGFGAGLVLAAGLFGVGVWTCVFGGEKGRTSRKTGADKRTSGFPFESAESARSKKREGKEERREKEKEEEREKVKEKKKRSMARTSSWR